METLNHGILRFNDECTLKIDFDQGTDDMTVTRINDVTGEETVITGGGDIPSFVHIFSITPSEDTAEITVTGDFGRYAPNMFTFNADGELVRPTGSIIGAISGSVANITSRSSTVEAVQNAEGRVNVINANGSTDYWARTLRVDATTSTAKFTLYRTDQQFRFLAGQNYIFVVIENLDIYY